MINSSMQNCLSVDLEVALEDFMLKVQFDLDDERLVLFGQSGAGKTTLLKSLAGLFKAHRGSIQLNGRSLYDSSLGISIPPQARRIGYVPQQYALFPHLTIAQNIAYGIPAVPRINRGPTIERWIRLMRLENQAYRKPGEVSGGQQQRAALARAMASEPELLLMDEPFAALDQVLRSHLRDEIRRVSEQFRIPMIIVTHDPVEAYSIGDRVVVLQDGKVLQKGEREDVFRSPSTPGLARLLGMSNIYPAEILGHKGQRAQVRLFSKVVAIETGGSFATGHAQVGFRPEAVELNHSPSEDPAQVGLVGRLIEVQASGYDHLLRFRVEQAGNVLDPLQAQLTHRDFLRYRLSLGDACQLMISSADLHLFPQAGDETL